MGFMDSLKGVVSSALGDNANIMNMANQLISDNGGIAGLVTKFKTAGFDNIIQSWISNGSNLPISAEQIQSILGSTQIQNLATKFGMDSNMISSLLAKGLPMIVDKLTAGGKLPSA